MSESSGKLVTINSHELYTMSIAASSWNIPHCIRVSSGNRYNAPERCVLNNILMASKSEEEHFRNLTAVFKHLLGHGVGGKTEKCSFLQENLMYLEHMLSANGIHASPKKMEALLTVPAPKTM